MRLERLEWEEFRSEVRRWISNHPEEFRRLLEEALQEAPTEPVLAAQWAARTARTLWARAGLEPPKW
jgi:hypothetical protein